MEPKNNNAKPQKKGASRASKVSERYIIFGENLRHARRERGFTSEVLAKFLEISTAYVGLIERGERSPSLDTFIKICEFFGKTAESMFTPQKAGLAMTEGRAAYTRQLTEAEAVRRKTMMITSMLGTFSADELDHVIGTVKSFKSFSSNKAEEEE